MLTINWVADLIDLIFILLCGWELLFLIKEYGLSSLGLLFVNLAHGVILLGLIRLLFFLTEANILKIDEITLMVGWHIIFYLAITIFLFSLRSIFSNISLDRTTGSISKLLLFGRFSILVSVILITQLPYLNHFIVNSFQNAFFDSFGLLHFIALVYALVTAYYLNRHRAYFTGQLGIIGTPLLLALSFLSLIHLWELLSENWQVIPVSMEMAEGIESILWVPVFILLFYTFWNFRKVKV